MWLSHRTKLQHKNDSINTHLPARCTCDFLSWCNGNKCHISNSVIFDQSLSMFATCKWSSTACLSWDWALRNKPKQLMRSNISSSEICKHAITECSNRKTTSPVLNYKFCGTLGLATPHNSSKHDHVYCNTVQHDQLSSHKALCELQITSTIERRVQTSTLVAAVTCTWLLQICKQYEN